MSDETGGYKPSASANMWVHEPLPYTVRLREMLTEDSAPAVKEYKVIAYSVFEAGVQAIMQAGGVGIDDMKFKLEHITPDVPHYTALLAAQLFTEIMKGKK